MAKEKCAVFGIRSDKDVFDSIYYGLYSMQHRGQESAGLAVCSNGIRVHKAMGLVSEVFKNVYLSGKTGIGHVRYSTTGESRIENAQPLLINYSQGSFAIAHNGNVFNSEELRENMESRGGVFSTTSDTEVIAHLIVQEHLKTGDFIKGIKNSMNQLLGAYSLIILTEDELIAVRDPKGVRPLVLGKKGDSHVIASESCALDVLDYTLVRDVKPSEILVIGDKIKSFFGPRDKPSHCMFEYVYFARPDSILNGVSVYAVRKNLGATLAREGKVDADIVTAVPDSGVTSAVGYAIESNISYTEGLMKNRYIGRTFILPEQNQRDLGVKVKLNPIRSEVEGKRLILVDDSIVRGTTLKRIIELLKGAGASEVHVRISSPPIRHPCLYGIDMQTSKEFIASNKTVEEICKRIGADSLVYTSIEGLVKAIGLPRDKLCLACLNGDYPIKDTQTRLEMNEVLDCRS
ncbi:MAG: amidophosphoribosyltransferase [Candidatus Altiarchaeota archaeon]